MWHRSSRLIPRHPTTVRAQEDPNVAQIQSTDPRSIPLICTPMVTNRSRTKTSHSRQSVMLGCQNGRAQLQLSVQIIKGKMSIYLSLHRLCYSWCQGTAEGLL